MFHALEHPFQGFFVKVELLLPSPGLYFKNATIATVNFAESNQSSAAVDTFLKNTRAEVKLSLTDGQKVRIAELYYLDNVTTGFDSGWEGEVFSGVASTLSVFTDLVADSQGKKYQVQSLPISEMESIVIPVGVIAEAGKELTFSIEQTNFPTDVKVYLEDRVAKTFNELTDSKTFKVTLSEALNDVGRFYMHASKNLADGSVIITSRSLEHVANSLHKFAPWWKADSSWPHKQASQPQMRFENKLRLLAFSRQGIEHNAIWSHRMPLAHLR